MFVSDNILRNHLAGVTTVRSLQIRNWPLRTALLADFLGMLGSQVSLVAVPSYAVLVLGTTALEAAVLASVQFLPSIFLIGAAGRLVDRMNRRMVLVASSALYSIAALLISTTFIVPDGMRVYYLYGMVIIAATFQMQYSVGFIAYLPGLASNQEDLPHAISANAGLRSGARLVGQAIAGAIIVWLSAGIAIAVDALLSLVRAALLLFATPRTPSSSRNSSPGQSMWGVITKDDWLLRLHIAYGLMTLGGGMIFGVFFVYAYRVLGLSAIDLGGIFTAGAASSLAAASISARLIMRYGLKRTVAIGALFASLSLLLVIAAKFGSAVATLYLYEVCFSFGSTLFAVGLSLSRQRAVDSSQLGGAAAVTAGVYAYAMVAGPLLGGLLSDVLSLELAIVAGGLLATCGALNLFGRSRPTEGRDGGPSTGSH